MFDIHSHIIPQFDDGARSIEEAVCILEDMKKQGCTHVIATPHFYPQSNDIANFKNLFARRYHSLLGAINGKDTPVILTGCEVYYFPAISTSADLQLLTLNNSKYILLELPLELSPSVLDSLVDLNLNRGFVPIIAHIERYAKSRYYGNLLEFVSSGLIRAQINASSLVKGRFLKRTCINLIKNGLVSYIASDAHNIKRRPVCFDKAFRILDRKFGPECKQTFISNSIALLNEIGIDGIEQQ